MKKIIMLICIFMLCISLFGCKAKQDDNSDNAIPATNSEKAENTNIGDNEEKTKNQQTDDVALKQPTEKSEDETKQTAYESSEKVEQTTDDPVDVPEQTDANTSDIGADNSGQPSKPVNDWELNSSSHHNVPQGKKEIAVNIAKPFSDADNMSSDSFVATIVSATSLVGEKITFNNIDEYDKYCLYTVKIEKTYRQTFVEQGAEIYFISQLNPEEYYWNQPLEVGKKYLLCGVVQTYKGKPMVVNLGKFSARIEDDGTLIPVSHAYTLSAFKTLKDVEENVEFIKYCQSDFDNFDLFGYTQNAQADRAVIVSDIKEKLTVTQKDKETFGAVK